jgi:hypothetical protein
MTYRNVPGSRYDPAEMDALTIPELYAVLEVAGNIVQVRVCKLHEQAVDFGMQGEGGIPIATAFLPQLLQEAKCMELAVLFGVLAS